MITKELEIICQYIILIIIDYQLNVDLVKVNLTLLHKKRTFKSSNF